MNEWMNEWINVWMNEWTNEWIKSVFYLLQGLHRSFFIATSGPKQFPISLAWFSQSGKRLQTAGLSPLFIEQPWMSIHINTKCFVDLYMGSALTLASTQASLVSVLKCIWNFRQLLPTPLWWKFWDTKIGGNGSLSFMATSSISLSTTRSLKRSIFGVLCWKRLMVSIPSFKFWFLYPTLFHLVGHMVLADLGIEASRFLIVMKHKENIGVVAIRNRSCFFLLVLSRKRTKKRSETQWWNLFSEIWSFWRTYSIFFSLEIEILTEKRFK